MVADFAGPRPPGSGSCCGSSHGVSILDYIERGLVRNRSEPLPVIGDVLRDSHGRMAQFSVQLDDGVIESVSFKASFCVTLIAYCELLAEWATGATLRRAAGIRPADLAVALTCVPPDKRDCAMLAKAALSSAIQTTLEGGST